MGTVKVTWMIVNMGPFSGTVSACCRMDHEINVSMFNHRLPRVITFTLCFVIGHIKREHGIYGACDWNVKEEVSG